MAPVAGAATARSAAERMGAGRRPRAKTHFASALHSFYTAAYRFVTALAAAAHRRRPAAYGADGTPHEIGDAGRNYTTGSWVNLFFRTFEGVSMRRLPFLLVWGSLWLAGCDRVAGNAAERDVPEAERYGGTAVLAGVVDLPSLAPVGSRSFYAQDVQLNLLFTPVVHLDETLQAGPALAERWEISDDSTLLTLYLRDDVYWHDGVKTTAWDLELAFETDYGPGGLLAGPTSMVHHVEVVDSFTFRVGIVPQVEFMQFWRLIVPVPRHLLAGLGPREVLEHPLWSENPVGNGPFRVVSREPGVGWTFEANPNYPSALGGRPYLDRIVYRMVPDSVLRDELAKGEIDLLVTAGPALAREMKDQAAVRFVSYPSMQYSFMAWNTRRPALADARVRRALTNALDRRRAIEEFAFGYGQLANTPVSPIHWAHDARIGAELEYDPARARTLLAEAGWEDRNGDGLVENAAGEPLRIRIAAAVEGFFGPKLMQMAVEKYRAIGVTVEPELIPFTELLRRISSPERDFDAAILAEINEFRLDTRGQFHCSSSNNPTSYTGYCSPAMDRLLDAVQSIHDRRQARGYWLELQQLMVQEQPYTFLLYQEHVAAMSPRLQDVRPDARGVLLGAGRWWIGPEQR
jgi:peptide/nickel transport system substrate-binding protein